MRIVYCTDNIAHLGGIGGVTVAKASALADIDGNEVWICVTDHRTEPLYKVSDKVHIVNLGINYYEDDWKGRLYVLKGIFVKRRLHKKKLQDVLEQIRPDVVIATGTSEKNFLPSIRLSSKPLFIREIHFNRNYRMTAATSAYDRFAARVADMLDYHLFIRRYDRIAVLTPDDKTGAWQHNDRVVVVPNPCIMKTNDIASLHNKTVIAAGRLTYQKNFSHLIDIWNSIHDEFPDWQLQIWGDGAEKEMLEKQIQDCRLQQCVRLCGVSDKMQQCMTEASVYAMTSRFEGFPLVLAEALSVGLPVVSYDCPNGPRNVVTDGDDGFLVPLNDKQAFALRLKQLMADEQLRRKMGTNALRNMQRFTLKAITATWMTIFSGK